MIRRTRHQAGFTLVELIIFIVVVGVGLAGILAVFNTSVKSSADPMVRKQAAALAESVLEEILLKDFALAPGATAGTDRASYNNVDEYNGKTESTLTGLPSGYTLAIAVTPATVGSVAMKRVTVTVSRGAVSLSLSGYRANY